MKQLIYFIILFLLQDSLFAKSTRFRIILNDDPASSLCIAWDQISGVSPKLYFGSDDYGNRISLYPHVRQPDNQNMAKGMNTHFVNLYNLRPNTVYYFVVADSEGLSKRYSFRTLPDDHNTKISYLIGAGSYGDRNERIKANKLLAALHPHFIIINGNMTESDDAQDWKDWLDDWEFSFSTDGRITAFIPNRGVKESNASLKELFNVKNPEIFSSFAICRGMLKIFTMNSNIAVNGNQKNWLEKELSQSQQNGWKIACYYHSIRHKIQNQPDEADIRKNWGYLFDQYGVQLAFEGENGFARYSYPIKISNQKGNLDGFIPDESNGIVYIGGSGWTSEKEEEPYKKALNFASESFQHFQLIFAELAKIEIRTIDIRTSNHDFRLRDVNRFDLPDAVKLWAPEGIDILTVINRQKNQFNPYPRKIMTEIQDPKVEFLSDGTVDLTWNTIYEKEGMIYKIQSSSNRKYWKTIAESEGLGSNKSKPHLYAFNDLPGLKSGKLYYRIIALDNEGNEVAIVEIDARILSSDANIESIEISKRIGLLNTEVLLYLDEPTDIEIFDTELNEVFTQKIPLKKGRHKLSFNVKHLNIGNYLFELTQGAQTIRKNLSIIP